MSKLLVYTAVKASSDEKTISSTYRSKVAFHAWQVRHVKLIYCTQRGSGSKEKVDVLKVMCCFNVNHYILADFEEVVNAVNELSKYPPEVSMEDEP